MNTKDKLNIILNISGLTQVQLAQRLKTSYPTVNSWINDRSKPRKKAIEKIDRFYFDLINKEFTEEDRLSEKKSLIFIKSKNYKNILKEILNNSDIYEQFLLALTYNTNKIEGSTLTMDETKAIMFDNVGLSNKHIVEHLEVKNHEAALRYIFSSIKKIDQNLILKLHSILMNGILENAGQYRKHPVRILGSNVPTANYLKIPELMNSLIKKVNSSDKDKIAHIAKIHSQFEQIHPFSDGNGRIGRLLTMIMLLYNNLPPAIIKQEKKRFYNSSLRKSQLIEDYVDLEEFICDSIINGFKIIERK